MELEKQRGQIIELFLKAIFIIIHDNSFFLRGIKFFI